MGGSSSYVFLRAVPDGPLRSREDLHCAHATMHTARAFYGLSQFACLTQQLLCMQYANSPLCRRDLVHSYAPMHSSSAACDGMLPVNRTIRFTDERWLVKLRDGTQLVTAGARNPLVAARGLAAGTT